MVEKEILRNYILKKDGVVKVIYSNIKSKKLYIKLKGKMMNLVKYIKTNNKYFFRILN